MTRRSGVQPHPFLGCRPFGLGRHPRHAAGGRGQARSGRSEEARIGLSPAVRPCDREGEPRLLRRDAGRQRYPRRAHRGYARRHPPLQLSRRQGCAPAPRPALVALRLSGQDSLVGTAPSPRRHAHRFPRDARLGAGAQAFFAMRFSAPLKGHAFLDRDEKVPYKGFQGPGRGSDALAEKLSKALEARLDFGALTAPLEVRVALSGVDEAGAVANLDAEGADFDAIRARTEGEWRKALGALEIEAPAPMRTNLYTALYHSLLAPSVWSDVDGRYRGPDDAVHMAKDFTFRSTFSLWDTFRAQHPLLTLIQPGETQQRHRQIARREPQGQPARHPARVAVPRTRNLDDDRLSTRSR